VRFLQKLAQGCLPLGERCTIKQHAFQREASLQQHPGHIRAGERVHVAFQSHANALVDWQNNAGARLGLRHSNAAGKDYEWNEETQGPRH